MKLVPMIKERVKAWLPFNCLYARKHRKILESHKAVAEYWDKVIKQYQCGEIEHYSYRAKVDLKGAKVIWQYWGQGIELDSLPPLVRICFDSVDKHAGEYQVIRLSDATVEEYLDIPEAILDKVRNGAMRRVFFSDLLRVMLLSSYGGIWLDATILMTGPFPQTFMSGDHFCFQRDVHEPFQAIWEKSFIYYFSWHPAFQVNMLSSILWAKRGSEMMPILADLLTHYWLSEGSPQEYFFFQILYHRLVTGDYSGLRPSVVSDCPPHILHMLINGARLPYSYRYALEHSVLHKLTYFGDDELAKLKEILQL